MDLHNRYLHSPSLNILLLQRDNKCKDDIFVELHHLIQLHNREMTEEKLDINRLEICRMLLCYEYQFVFKNIGNQDNEKDTINKKFIIPADAEQTRFPNIDAIFPPQHLRSTSESLVLHDIIILQMVLYHDIKSIKKHLRNFLNSSHTFITKSNTRVMYMKILEYFLEALYLHQFLHNSLNDNEEDVKELSSMYLEIIKSWMKIKEDHEWKVFASMFLILTKTFDSESILFPLWDYMMNEISDLGERLTVLSLMVDTCFTSSDSTYIHRDIYTSSTFWSLILTGLQSSFQQYRKQALYIMKRAVNSVSKIYVQKFVHLKLTKTQITPFICSDSHAKALHSIDSIKQAFFLVYEELEESQYHLVAPALTYIINLVEAYKERKSCKEYCFDIVWLQCILEKVLQHKNNNVLKWGILYTCKLNESSIFNDQFLELFVNVLNNSFLYEFYPNDECPEIVKELSTLFTCTEERNLLNRFLKKVSEITWSPVAIFYIIHTLQTLQLPYETIKYNNWQAIELKAIKTLVETNLNMHSHILRIASQIELLKAISKYVLKIDDLILFANTLAIFPAEEGLVRGTVPWITISTCLQKTLSTKDAESFVENICKTYLGTCNIGNVNSTVNPRTFALMVYLLHDANLILFNKTCPTKKSLNNWLSTLNGVNLRPYVDLRSTVDAIEFISHLLNFSAIEFSGIMMKDLILLYLPITFNILIQNMRKMSKNMTYEDYTRYISIVSSHIVNAGLFMPKRDVNNYVEKLQHESILLSKDMMEQTNGLNNLQCLYGLHILHLSQNIMVSPFAKTFYEEYLLNTDNYLTFLINNSVTSFKGKIASAHYQILAKLLHQYLMINSTYLLVHISKLLSKLLSFLELGGPEIASEIASILTVIINNTIISNASDEVDLEDIFQLCWKNTFAGKRNNIFWITIENLTGVIINNKFFSFPKAIEFTMQVSCAKFIPIYIRIY